MDSAQQKDWNELWDWCLLQPWTMVGCRNGWVSFIALTLEADLLQVRSVCRALDKAGYRSILSAHKAPRLGSASVRAGIPLMFQQGVTLGSGGDRGKLGGETPFRGGSGSSLSPASPAAPSHCPLSPFPVGWCLGGGSGGLCLPGQVCQPSSLPPSLPAGIKLLTWDPTPSIAAPTSPPCQPRGRARRQREQSGDFWLEGTGSYAGSGAACAPRRTGTGSLTGKRKGTKYRPGRKGKKKKIKLQQRSTTFPLGRISWLGVWVPVIRAAPEDLDPVRPSANEVCGINSSVLCSVRLV